MSAPDNPERPVSPSVARSALLEDRFVRFAVGTGEAVKRLRSGPPGSAIAYQLSRSGTAPAAAYAEARGAESARDYIHKMQLCLKELRETLVWLKIASGLNLATPLYASLERECNELIAIAVTCIKKAKGRL